MTAIHFSAAAEALFRLEAPTAVSAGAGSGKTTALVELCLRLLDGRALEQAARPNPVEGRGDSSTALSPAEIVAITFTEKAAEELTERLRGAIAAKAREPGPSAAAWRDRLAALDRMAVGTIHGFCGRLLREHALEAGLDPDFEVLDDERASGLLGGACRGAVVAALDAGQPEAGAWAAALGAGGARGGLVPLLAGIVRARATRGDAGPVPAGAPDPAGVADARARLLGAAEGLRAARADAKGGGARAVVEDVSRALDGLQPGDRDGPVTPGALARLLAVAAAARGREKRIVKADGEVLRTAKDALAEAAERFGPLAADALAGPQKTALCALAGVAEARYVAGKRAARAVDFDDLLRGARDLLRADRALLAEVRGRLRALLVDEYQDVNPVQQDLFDLLSGPSGAGVGPGPLLVAVGDPKQSIYRFRGADVAVFARLLRRFAGGEGRVLHLSENHRSTAAVLDLVNEVSARAFQPPAGAAPRDDELVFGEADRLVARREDGERPGCELLVDAGAGKAAQRREREAAAIAARIGALLSGAAGVPVRDRGNPAPRPPRPGDVAILFRRLTQLGPYERALRAAGIPYRLARGGGFYQAPEVRDLGELCAALADPGDAGAWAALLRSPLCAVSDGTLVLLARRIGLARLASLEEAALPGEPELPAGERARLVRLLDVFRDLHALRDRLPLGELLARGADALDLEAALLASPDGDRRAVNLRKALALAVRFGRDGGGAAGFAGQLRRLAAAPPREPEAELDGADAVLLVSIHQAKGLEWPIVFVPDLGARARNDTRRFVLDGAGRLQAHFLDAEREAFLETAGLAAARDDDRRAAAAESRRLLYVALTRARDHLVLSGEASRAPDSWRALVDAALAARPELARAIPVEEAGAAGAGADALPSPIPSPAATSIPAPPLRLAGPPPLPSVRMAVTELAEYARCPRRHHLGRVLGLAEPRGVSGVPAADDPGRATARGTLAHAMLAEADLGAPPLERRAQLVAAASRRGYDPAAPGVKQILAEVARFADSPAGRALGKAAAEGRLRREVPFLLRLDGPEPGRPGAPSVYLVGAIDAFVREKGAGNALQVIDYKYATPRPGSADRYRLQLAAYLLAAGRAHPGAKLSARLQFLRGDRRSVDVTPTEPDLARFAALLPRLALEAARGGGERPPAELGRDEGLCRAEGCGFVARCYPRAR